MLAGSGFQLLATGRLSSAVFEFAYKQVKTCTLYANYYVHIMIKYRYSISYAAGQRNQ
jgi:hypothetical protein